MVLSMTTFVSFIGLNFNYASCNCLEVYDVVTGRWSMAVTAVFRNSSLKQPPKVCCFKM
jgi:hypothetical protein